MLHLPRPIIKVLHPFRRLFRAPSWEHAQRLLVGAILTLGPRTVAAALRVLGLHHEPHFQTSQRVLKRATWSARALSHLLLLLVLRACVPDAAPVVVGIDETIERRRGAKIAAKGIYRDPVRSSKEHFVKTSGLRWVSLQVLAPIPWIGRVWALPFLTVLAPSERYHAERGKRHTKVHVWGRQLIVQLRRWLPARTLVVVADSTYAVIELLDACRRMPVPVTLVPRLRLDAALYDPAPSRQPGAVGRPHVKGTRQPTLAQRLQDSATVGRRVTVRWYGGGRREVEGASGTAGWDHSGLPPVPLHWVLIRDPKGHFAPQALLGTDLAVTAVQIVEWFVVRWQLEVTFHETRTHLGVETQRQWAAKAITRTTPALLGLFSLVTLFAHELLQGRPLPLRQTAWYAKTAPTFADTLAFVRHHRWPAVLSGMSPETPDMVKLPRPVFQHLAETLAFAT